IEGRLDGSSGWSRSGVMLGNLNSVSLMMIAGHRGGGREGKRGARGGNSVLLEEPFHAGDIGADESRVGDHQWLVAIAYVVRVESPFLGCARLDQEDRLGALDDHDDALRLVEDEVVATAQDRAARKGETEHEPAVGPSPSADLPSVLPSQR